MATPKKALVEAVKASMPAMAGVADSFTVAQLEAILTAAGKGAPVTPKDGDIIPPMDVPLDGDRFLQVACARYQGRVSVGIRRGWVKDGERQLVMNRLKTPYLDSRDQVTAVIAALTATLEHIS